MPHVSRIRHHYPYTPHLSLRLSEGSLVYLSNSIRTFGLDLVGLFVPIYLFTLNFPYLISGHSFLNSAFWPVVYFGIRSIVAMVFSLFFANWFFSNFSLKKILILGNVLTLFTTFTLFILAKNPMLFFIPATLSGLVSVFYWVPFRLFFAQKDGDGGKYGKSIGFSEFLQGLVHAVAPLLGGLLIANYGFGVTFLLSSFFILLSIIPVVEYVNEKKVVKHDSKSFLDYFVDAKYTRAGVSFIGMAMDDIIFTIFWSLLLLYWLEDFAKIGLLNFVSVFLGALSLLVAVKYVDGKYKERVHIFGIGVTAIFNVVRVFLSNPFGAYVLEILDRLNPFYVVPFDARTYEIAEKSEDDLGFLLYRNLSLHFGILIALFLSLIIMFFVDWVFVFLIASVGSVMSYYISVAREKDFGV